MARCTFALESRWLQPKVESLTFRPCIQAYDEAQYNQTRLLREHDD